MKYFDLRFVLMTLHHISNQQMSSLIKTQNLNFSFLKGVKTLDNVNLDVPAGSILCLPFLI